MAAINSPARKGSQETFPIISLVPRQKQVLQLLENQQVFADGSDVVPTFPYWHETGTYVFSTPVGAYRSATLNLTLGVTLIRY